LRQRPQANQGDVDPTPRLTVIPPNNTQTAQPYLVFTAEQPSFGPGPYQPTSYLAPTQPDSPIAPASPQAIVSPTTLGHVNQIFGTSMTTRQPSVRKMTKPERKHTRVLLTHNDPAAQWSCWRVYYTCITLPFLSVCLDKIGGMSDPRIQRAWREKVGLCSIIVLMCFSLGFLTFGFVKVACDRGAQKDVFFAKDIPRWPKLGEDYAHRYIIRGYVYNYGYARYPAQHASMPKLRGQFEVNSQLASATGRDLSMTFPVPTTSCDAAGYKPPARPCWPSWMNGTAVPYCHDYSKYPTVLDGMRVGWISFGWKDLEANETAAEGTVGLGMRSSGLMVFNGKILDMSYYLQIAQDPNNRFMGEQVHQIIVNSIGTDATQGLVESKQGYLAGQCLQELYMMGYLEADTMGCIATDIVLNVSLVVILGVVLVRFFMALTFEWTLSWQLGRLQDKNLIQQNRSKAYGEWSKTHMKKMPAPTNAEQEVVLMRKGLEPSPERYELSEDFRAFGEIYTVLLVTTYSEGHDSCKTTLDSLAKTTYSDPHKLLFIVSDGLITGSENDKSTPELLVDMLELDPRLENPPKPVSYLAVADGSKRHNMAQVYAGYYVTEPDPATGDPGHRVPTVLIVKCGTPEEAHGSKPGNRGKRDSQIILMNFFQHVMFDDRLSPLEYDLFCKLRFVTGVSPDRYEIVLMVDADTKVAPDALSRMIAAMASDEQVIGLCGETRIGNKSQSWVTRIQVFEYYISHHLTKSFESMFGGVTCLPGCFCMWRIKGFKDGGWVPIVCNPDILMEYSQTQVETLHEKNLVNTMMGELMTFIVVPWRRSFFDNVDAQDFPDEKTHICS
jgi:chitin synthase